ncbi:MAG TPA: transglycosylase domain-containing protein [Nocardioidaceae bacterium]|nr:transglycosylase domain-containing protein [Nocardioidaceae bacterium]
MSDRNNGPSGNGGNRPPGRRRSQPGARKRTTGKQGTGANRAKGKKKPRSSWPRRIVKWGLLSILALFIIGCAAFAYGYTTTSIPNPNKDFQAQTTLIYYKDGHHVLGKLATQNRTSIPLSEVPKSVQDAVIAAEDRTFYTNKGIDPKGIVRAAFNNAQGNATQGASTITQQYVKVLYLSQERTWTRKIKEAFLSLKIQRQQSKQQILQGYLNTIYFGRGAYGIQAAAQAYFNVDAKDLGVKQAAALAAILNSPGNLDPAEGKGNRERLIGRYQYVLQGMAAMHNLSKTDAIRYQAHLPKFPKIPQSSDYAGQKGYMLNMVKHELEADGFSDAEIEGGGLRVTTTFTRGAMHAAIKAVHDRRPKHLKGLHVAVAEVDPQTGGLKGFYAGQDYLKSNGAINWAKAGGAPGSSFKPYALAAAIEDGYSLKSTFQGNSPYVFPNGKKVVNEGPNGGNDYGARISLTKATEESVNTAFVDMTVSMKDGPQKILDEAVQMGIPRDTPGLEPTSGISLGSATISPIDMANAYGTIADGGNAKDWFVVRKVTDAAGATRFDHDLKTTQAVPNDVDRDVSYALQQVVQHGTGTNAQALGRPAAGKTGTATNADGNVSSSWFVGYTPQLATAVMYVRGDGNANLSCTNPNGRICHPGYLVPYFGAVYPTQTWTETMKLSLAHAPVKQFPPPANVKATNTAGPHAPLPTYTPPPPTPTRTERSTPTPTPTLTPSPTPTFTPSPTPTYTPSPSPTLTPSPTGGSTSPCTSTVCVGGSPPQGGSGRRSSGSG